MYCRVRDKFSFNFRFAHSLQIITISNFISLCTEVYVSIFFNYKFIHSFIFPYTIPYHTIHSFIHIPLYHTIHLFIHSVRSLLVQRVKRPRWWTVSRTTLRVIRMVSILQKITTKRRRIYHHIPRHNNNSPIRSQKSRTGSTSPHLLQHHTTITQIIIIAQIKTTNRGQPTLQLRMAPRQQALAVQKTPRILLVLWRRIIPRTLIIKTPQLIATRRRRRGPTPPRNARTSSCRVVRSPCRAIRWHRAGTFKPPSECSPKQSNWIQPTSGFSGIVHIATIASNCTTTHWRTRTQRYSCLVTGRKVTLGRDERWTGWNDFKRLNKFSNRYVNS